MAFNLPYQPTSPTIYLFILSEKSTKELQLEENDVYDFCNLSYWLYMWIRYLFLRYWQLKFLFTQKHSRVGNK